MQENRRKSLVIKIGFSPEIQRGSSASGERESPVDFKACLRNPNTDPDKTEKNSRARFFEGNDKKTVVDRRRQLSTVI